jgi:hypothetical protein
LSDIDTNSTDQGFDNGICSIGYYRCALFEPVVHGEQITSNAMRRKEVGDEYLINICKYTEGYQGTSYYQWIQISVFETSGFSDPTLLHKEGNDV